MTSPLHSVEHYENFPVASWLMPRRLRPAIVAIYGFARHGDDLADEGDAPACERLRALGALREDLERAQRGEPPVSDAVARLVPHVHAHGLDWSRFTALLSAFEQDVRTHSHPDEASLDDYCSRSADPVGHLVLALTGQLDDVNRALSDRICSALQRINFVQDVAVDWRRGRHYLPLDALSRHGADRSDLEQAARLGRAGPQLRACIAEQARFAGQRLASGAPLAARVGGRLGWELRAIVAGGARILERLQAVDHDPFAARPTLGRKDALPLALAILRMALTRPDPAAAQRATEP